MSHWWIACFCVFFVGAFCFFAGMVAAFVLLILRNRDAAKRVVVSDFMIENVHSIRSRSTILCELLFSLLLRKREKATGDRFVELNLACEGFSKNALGILLKPEGFSFEWLDSNGNRKNIVLRFKNQADLEDEYNELAKEIANRQNLRLF